jgi:hypothetical protein
MKRQAVFKAAAKQEPLCTIGGNVNYYNHCGKSYGDFLKKPKSRTAI